MGILLSSLAAVLATAQLSAVSVNAADEPSVTVRMSDLDLTNRSHLARLDTRVRSAVNRVCPMSGKVDLTQRDRSMKCRTLARNNARLQVERAVAAASMGRSATLAAR